MIKEMIVNATPLEIKIAILEDDQIAELYIERNKNRGILGNIYKGKVTKVLPGMQSAFVDIGLEKDAFLYVSDFIEDAEEYDKVFSAEEDTVADAIAEIETSERPARRDPRRGEKPRWRDRRERWESPREPARVAAPPVPVDAEPAMGLENWFLTSETERAAEKFLDPSAPMGMSTEIPPPGDLVSLALEMPPGEKPIQGHSPIAGSEAPALERPTEPTLLNQPIEPAPDAPLNSASLSDRGDVAPFSADGGNRKPGLNPRRRGGPGARRKRYTTARHSKHNERQSIDDMLREGQEILVQVAKEPIAKKGARVTSHIALPGRYLVYMPTVEHIGVSRKIASDAERSRLKEVVLKNRDRFGGGIIVRTAAEEHSEEDLTNDLNYLVKLWEDVRGRTEKASAPALIHSELNLVQRLLRDQFSFEFAAVRVDEETEYQRVVEFVDKIYPNLVHRVKLFTKDTHIFDEYGITAETEKLLQPKIWLKSGGYIVINQTEALVSIDINTGKFVGRGNSLEETITRTNLEAVREIVKQIRLRDLGGIIVIDFIDMDERKNRKRVMEALSQEIAKDKSPNKILEFNEFGLVAITRKRVRQSLERTLCQPCPYCTGSGMVKSVATTCYSIYHELEKMKNYGDGRGEIMIRVHPDVARALRETESNVIAEVRHMLNREVLIKADPGLHIEHFNIVT